MLVFIDGAEGATGLQLEERISMLPFAQLIKPEYNMRKDIETRRELLNRADVSFLCLPDDTAKEAVSLIENANTVVIDASTAHRTAGGWAYGFPELSQSHYNAVKGSNRIAVPGCHASGFCALVYPLVQSGIISQSETLFCNSLTGYSGGGKKMIAEFEGGGASAARAYALSLNHKHIPEMRHVCGLMSAPVFQPVIVNTRQGMIVSIPVARNAREIWEALESHYRGAENVVVMPFGERDSLDIETMAGTDKMELFVFGGETQTVMSARFDNLGKGSAGAAVQCMRLRKCI